MSHIYDALKKSKGQEPPKPGDPGEPGEGPPPPPPPPQRPTAQGGDSPRRIRPETAVEGGLLGEPHAAFLRQLDPLRENTEVLLGRSPRKVIGLSGAVLDEGASTMALHFAYLLARLGEKQTLLVDADMGRSSVSLSDALGQREGLSELLRRELAFEKVILATEDVNLHFLPAGIDRVHHSAAIGSGRLRPLFEALGSLYDAVVVDIPAVLEHPEAPYVGAACDGVVLVVRANRTRRELAQRAIAELNFARCRILGTVLNGQKGALPSALGE